MTAGTTKLLERRRQLMGSAYRLFYDNPVHLVRGEGVWLFDADGKKYLDMYNNVPHANILKLRCPLVLTRDDADFLIGKLDAAITSLSGFVRS